MHTASVPSLYLAFHLPKLRTEADRAYSEERLTQPLCFNFLLFKAPPQEATHPSSSYELCDQVKFHQTHNVKQTGRRLSYPCFNTEGVA